jgi:hypothetical protein
MKISKFLSSERRPYRGAKRWVFSPAIASLLLTD